MANKCPYCGKTVYQAEEKLYEGASYHSACFSKYTKAKADEALRARPTYNPDLHNRPAPVNPGHGTGGVVALDGKSAVEGEIAAKSPRGDQAQAAPSAAKFCTNCGTSILRVPIVPLHCTKDTGSKFCADCGTKLR